MPVSSYLCSQAEYASTTAGCEGQAERRAFTAAEIALDQKDMHEYNNWYLGRIQ